MPFSSLVRAIFEPGLRHFRVCFVSFSSIAHARLRWNRLTSFAEGSEEGARGDGKEEVSFEATVSSCLFQALLARRYTLARIVCRNKL